MKQNTTGYLKKFKQLEWKAMPVIAEPTTTTGQIRKDADGVAWVWTTGGKYVHARHFPHAEHISPSLAPTKPQLPQHYAFSHEPNPQKLWNAEDMRYYATAVAESKRAELEDLRAQLETIREEAETAQTELVLTHELMAQLDLTKASTFAAWEKKRAAAMDKFLLKRK